MAHQLMLLREMGRRNLLQILWSHNGFLNVGCEYAAWRKSVASDERGSCCAAFTTISTGADAFLNVVTALTLEGVMPSAYKLLQFALAVFGVVMLLLYPLAVWVGMGIRRALPVALVHDDRGHLRDTRRLRAQCGTEPGGQSQPDLVHRGFQRRTRRNDGGAVLR